MYSASLRETLLSDVRACYNTRMSPLVLGSQALSIEDVASVARGGLAVELADAARTRILQGRAALEAHLARGTRIYGVNTGVGGNIAFPIPPEQAGLFQLNLLRELSCATGQPLGADTVRAAMLLRVATFATGASAVRVELVESLIALLNRGLTPIVPRYGSVGASGDLIPSAYVARPLVGMGEVEYHGQRIPATEALKRAGLVPLSLAAKEGLALINGTTVMTAVATLLWVDAGRVLRALLGAIALSIEALEGTAEPFAPWVQQMKGHPGQIAVAEYFRRLLERSAMVKQTSSQSSYSLRCPPQGLGPAWEALADARPVIEREINSANDNPLIDPATGELYKAGKFLRRPHCAPDRRLENGFRGDGHVGQLDCRAAGGRQVQSRLAAQSGARRRTQFRHEGHAVERDQPGMRDSSNGGAEFDPLAIDRAIQSGCRQPGNARGCYRARCARMPAQRDCDGSAGGGAGCRTARRRRTNGRGDAGGFTKPCAAWRRFWTGTGRSRKTSRELPG